VLVNSQENIISWQILYAAKKNWNCLGGLQITPRKILISLAFSSNRQGNYAFLWLFHQIAKKSSHFLSLFIQTAMEIVLFLGCLIKPLRKVPIVTHISFDCGTLYCNNLDHI